MNTLSLEKAMNVNVDLNIFYSEDKGWAVAFNATLPSQVSINVIVVGLLL